MYALLIGVFIGQLQPRVVTANERDFNSMLYRNDQGCNNITRKDKQLVCEVYLTEEDDAVFIIKKEGAMDDYR